MNCPGATARRRSIAGAAASISSVCSIITTASAPRGTTPPVAIAVALPGATVSFGAWPQASTSALSVRRRGAASVAPTVSAARSAKPSTLARSNGGTSIGAATSCASTRPSASASATVSAAERRKIEMLLEARLRVFGRDDFEELLLPRGGAHRIEQRDLGACAAGVVHGNARISSCVPAAKAFALRRHQHPSVGARDRLHRPVAGRERLDAVGRAAHRHDLAMPTVETILRASVTGIVGSDVVAPVSRRNSGFADHKKPRKRRIEPRRKHQHRMSFRAAERGGFARRDAEAMDRDLADAPQHRDARIAASRAGAADRDDDIGLLVGQRAFERAHEDHVRRHAPRRRAKSPARRRRNRACATTRTRGSRTRTREMPDGLQRRHIGRAQPSRRRAAADGPAPHPRPPPSTPSPAVAPACASAPVTASGGSTASASRGIAAPASTHAGAGSSSIGA